MAKTVIERWCPIKISHAHGWKEYHPMFSESKWFINGVESTIEQARKAAESDKDFQYYLCHEDGKRFDNFPDWISAEGMMQAVPAGTRWMSK